MPNLTRKGRLVPKETPGLSAWGSCWFLPARKKIACSTLKKDWQTSSWGLCSGQNVATGSKGAISFPTLQIFSPLVLCGKGLSRQPASHADSPFFLPKPAALSTKKSPTSFKYKRHFSQVRASTPAFCNYAWSRKVRYLSSGTRTNNTDSFKPRYKSFRAS